MLCPSGCAASKAAAVFLLTYSGGGSDPLKPPAFCQGAGRGRSTDVEVRCITCRLSMLYCVTREWLGSYSAGLPRAVRKAAIAPCGACARGCLERLGLLLRIICECDSVDRGGLPLCPEGVLPRETSLALIANGGTSTALPRGARWYPLGGACCPRNSIGYSVPSIGLGARGARCGALADLMCDWACRE